MQYKYNTIYCCLLSFFVLVAGLAMIFFFLGPSRSGSYTLSVFVRLDILYRALPSPPRLSRLHFMPPRCCFTPTSPLIHTSVMYHHEYWNTTPLGKDGLSPDVSSNEHLFQGRVFALCTQHEQAGAPFIRYSRSSDINKSKPDSHEPTGDTKMMQEQEGGGNKVKVNLVKTNSNLLCAQSVMLTQS